MSGLRRSWGSHDPPAPLVAAVLLVADMAVGLSTLWLVPANMHDLEVLAVISVTSAALGLVLVRLPWHRWPDWTLIAGFGSLYLLETSLRASAGPVLGLAVRAVLAFVWLGLYFRPRTAAVAAPLVMGVILLGGWPLAPLELRGLLVALPVWVLVAVVLARLRRMHREADDLAERAFSGAPLGVALAATTPGGRPSLVRGNGVLVDMLGAGDAGLHGSAVSALVAADDRVRVQQALDGLATSSPRTVEAKLATANGQETWAAITVSALGPAWPPGGLVLHVQDVTERRRVQLELTRRALHDELTGLPGRDLFNDRLDHALARAKRAEECIAVLFVDLDRFKTVNDGLGHATGDQVLAVAAQRLHTLMRPGDTAARFGGDEFVVLCEDLRDAQQAAIIAARLREGLSRPIILGDLEVVVTASIGIATSSGKADIPAGLLLRDADAAMYRAKERGRNRYEIYDEALRSIALETLQTESQLRTALQDPDSQFLVQYQPVVDLATGRIVGAEALLRWQHPERGLLMPEAFLPIAEASNLILPLGAWVLRTACRDVAALRGRHRSGDFTVAVNVAPRQLGQRAFPDDVRGALLAADLPGTALCLEITERTLMNTVGSARADLPALRALGVLLAVDDFGIGYSSLSYISELPLDVLKIDESFVRALPERPALVGAIVGLATSLGLQTIAEGVENAAQEDALRRLGCNRAQGFLHAPALPLEAFYDHVVQRAQGSASV